MTRIPRTTRLVIVSTAFLLLAACATPDEVRLLAERTAANTAALGIATGQTAKASRRIAERRAANIARLQRETAAVRSRFEFDKTLMTQVGDSATLTLFGKLQTWSNKVQDHDNKAAIDEAVFEKAFLAGRAEIDAKSKSLKEVAGILAALAEEEKTTAHALFVGKFVKAVLDDVKEQHKASKESGKQAEEQLNEQQGGADDG